MTVLTKTRAYELTAFDHKSIACAEREVGKVGPYDVLVEMKAASLNFRDYMISAGVYNPNFKLPLIPLSDGAGEVIEVGAEVTEFKPGDKVASCFFQDWVSGCQTEKSGRSALGGEIDGILQAHKIFPERGLVKIPDGYSFEEGATLPCAALTAWNSLFESGNVKPGESVLVMGSGGVSNFALQFAKAAGAYVYATSSSDEKLERLKKMGADYTINYKNTPDWDKEVLDATNGRGVDHIVEVGGAGTLDKSCKAVRMAGHVSLIGVLSGVGKFDPLKVLMKAIRLQGVFVGSKAMFNHMNRGINANGIKPVIDTSFAVDDVSKAIEYMKDGQHFGKIVLKF
ncbi:MAG: NAD(P)-dependent alcohol dehydrogenase [Cyanobacteria bacterium]|nr:NAD(P)-dependent alcohol dehydrogenase [Cyanobacteriota bacterium]